MIAIVNSEHPRQYYAFKKDSSFSDETEHSYHVAYLLSLELHKERTLYYTLLYKYCQIKKQPRRFARLFSKYFLLHLGRSGDCFWLVLDDDRKRLVYFIDLRIDRSFKTGAAGFV